VNFKELIVPYVKKLKSNRLDDKQKAYMSILESNLNNIVSPFAHKLCSKYTCLTPTEIKTAHLVKDGKTTKEIAELSNSSIRTIESHRLSIRAKMGLKNSKTNLRSYLLSM
jgi:DNA-binding CsgD family transcriptional regulator